MEATHNLITLYLLPLSRTYKESTKAFTVTEKERGPCPLTATEQPYSLILNHVNDKNTMYWTSHIEIKTQSFTGRHRKDNEKA